MRAAHDTQASFISTRLIKRVNREGVKSAKKEKPAVRCPQIAQMTRIRE